MLRYCASRFVAHVGGWKQFCADLHLDPEGLLNFRIGWGLITQTDKAAQTLVFSAEEAAEFVRRETAAIKGDDTPEHGPVPVESVADLVRDWHVLLDDMVRHQRAG